MISFPIFQLKATIPAALEPPPASSGSSHIRHHTLTVVLLAFMMFLAPALGAPTLELLQDTLKSILVAFFALAAAFSFFWAQREQKGVLQLHAMLCLPLLLTVYALGSMAWSHSYLGGVEAIRWFLFSLLFFLGMNTLTLSRVTQLAWGIHLGAVMASLWAALQFWVDFGFFPQFANPASTFINRNFFAEFLVCTLPFSVFLMSSLRNKALAFMLTFSLGFNVVALMMAGTRSALVALLLLLLLLPVIIGLYRKQFVVMNWRWSQRLALLALLVATVWGLGSINTANPNLIAETGPGDAIDRVLKRGLSLTKEDEYSEGSASVRILMWKATAKMIQANTLTGVGAGAWEVQLPIYQEPGSQLETDLYAHNEVLQLIAEYGLAGWVFLLSLLSYLLWAAYRTWSDQSANGRREAPLRALALASVLMLLLVSNAGFPWRLASTGALFALGLAVLAASDIRLGAGPAALRRALPWTPQYSRGALGVAGLCLALALYIAQQAVACEARVVRAYQMARAIAQSGRPDAPRWERDKVEIIRLMREGIAINPHYRKITPLVADELAGWGDWENATWIWKSVLDSRPQVVAITANVARGYLHTGYFQEALAYLERAQKLQPTAPAVRSLHALFLIQSGQYQQAAQIAAGLLQADVADDSVTSLTYMLGAATGDWRLTVQALQLRIRKGKVDVANDWVNLGNVYSKAEVNNEAQALTSYRAALGATPSYLQGGVWAKIPPAYWDRLQQAVP